MALGWKANPFDLHFPPLSAVVVLIQLGINQNVFEAPIFASGHGVDASWIALAGMAIGNALVSLPLSRLAFGWSDWELLVILGIPTAIALGWLLVRVVPATLRWAFPASPASRHAIAVLTAFMLFGFYGSAGLDDGGPISHQLSRWSIFACFPIGALADAWIVGRRPTLATFQAAKSLPPKLRSGRWRMPCALSSCG